MNTENKQIQEKIEVDNTEMYMEIYADLKHYLKRAKDKGLETVELNNDEYCILDLSLDYKDLENIIVKVLIINRLFIYKYKEVDEALVIESTDNPYILMLGGDEQAKDDIQLMLNTII